MVTQIVGVNLSLGATETTETDIGDIEIPYGASRITGIHVSAALETGTATEGTLCHGSLDFKGAEELSGIIGDVACIIDAGQCAYKPIFHSVNINLSHLVPKSKIACGVTLTKAQTGDCHGMIALRFE